MHKSDVVNYVVPAWNNILIRPKYFITLTSYPIVPTVPQPQPDSHIQLALEPQGYPIHECFTPTLLFLTDQILDLNELGWIVQSYFVYNLPIPPLWELFRFAIVSIIVSRVLHL